VDATLGILQEFVPGAVDGWDLALSELRVDPDRFLGRLRRLGEVTGELHGALASDSTDPDFAPEEPSAEALALLTATVDEEIEAIFLDLPAIDPVAPIAGRGEEVRDRLRLFSHVGAAGRVIRHHGDYHLGQVLAAGDDWIVLDFEGEPARGLAERRRKRSPLRDVAGMLRSFAYVTSASQILHGIAPDAAWEPKAREEFLSGYFEAVDRSIVPANEESRQRLLSVFELEKAVYELRYELNNRPDWVGIPVAGILRLLESDL
jgi:trehalose synthase-fused probable maltokinase